VEGRALRTGHSLAGLFLWQVCPGLAKRPAIVAPAKRFRPGFVEPFVGRMVPVEGFRSDSGGQEALSRRPNNPQEYATGRRSVTSCVTCVLCTHAAHDLMAGGMVNPKGDHVPAFPLARIPIQA